MKVVRILALAAFVASTICTFQAAAKQEDAKKTGKACTYCHVKGNPKTLTDAGKYYKDHNKSLEGYKEAAPAK